MSRVTTMFNRIAVVVLTGLILFFAWFIAQQVVVLRSGSPDESFVSQPPDFDTLRVQPQRVVPLRVAVTEKAPDPIPVEMIPVAPPLQNEWPRWRGPSGQGIGIGTGYVDSWSDTEHVIWSVDVPGSGNSSPIILGDRVFLTTAYESGQRRAVLCFRRSDGELLWETAAPQAEFEYEVHRKNGYASATPCTDGEQVYAFLGAYGLLCLGLDGQVIWHHVPDVISAYHGTACSPLLYKDHVILYQDQRDGAFVAAYSKRTGERVWRTRREGSVGWGSPVAIRAGDRDLVIVSSQSEVTAYDPLDGKQVWNCFGNLSEVIPTPVAGHGLLFCSSGRSGPTLAIHPGGAGDVSETHIAWITRDGSPFVPSPLLAGDYLYMVDEVRRLASCYEASTGELKWRERLEASRGASPAPGRRRRRRSGFSASPVAVDNKVFFTNELGQTFVLRGGSEFELLHVNALNAGVLASPALAGGRWYFRTDTKLICIGSPSDSTPLSSSAE